MLFITGLLTLLAIAQAGGDHIKGGSVTQQKVAQEDIIPSPFNVKSAITPFGAKVIQQEASDPLSKTARGHALHHAVKTAASTPGKTQRSPGLHHAASSPVIQDQVTIEDPASSTIKNIKTLKTAATGKTRFSQQDIPARDPIARPVVQTTKTIQDPITGTTQIKTVKMVDTGKTRFSQDDKQVRDPIARPVIQTVKSVEEPATLSTKRIKTLGAASTNTRFTQDPIAQSNVRTIKTSEDPSASVVTKTFKTTVKTAEPSNLRSKATLKTAQQAIGLQRISNAPLSVVEAAKRNTLATSSAANAALLNSHRGIQSPGDSEGLLFNALADSEIQPGTGIVNELGEMILDEKTLQTLQNAGGIINENGRIALNDAGLELLQNIRGGNLLPYSSGISGTGTSSIHGRAPERMSPTGSINPSLNIRSSSIRTSSAALGSEALYPGTIGVPRRTQTINEPVIRSQTGGMRSRVISSTTTSSAGSSRLSGSSLSQPTPNLGRGVLSSNVLSAQRSQGGIGTTSSGSVIPGTAFFDGKEISIDGLKEGQIFDENLRPILSDIGRIEAPGSAVLEPRIITPQNAQTGVLRTPSVSGVTRSATGSLRSTGVSGLRATQNIGGGSSGVRIGTSQRTSHGTGITRTTGTLTSGTALFNGKEVTIDGLTEGQLFDENLRPLTSGAPISTSGQISSVPSRSTVARPIARVPQRSQSTGLRSSTVTSSSRGAIPSSRTSNTLLPQSVSNVRSGPLSTSVSSGQRRTQPIGNVRSGGPSTTGTVLFNGKEISVDGFREGQLFDENLRPVIPGTAISSSGQTSGVPLRSTASRPGARAPQRSQPTGIRSAAVSTSRGTISSPRTSSALLSQFAPNERSGSLTTTGASGQDSISGIRSGGSLTSGTVLFNGKVISVDGLKEGQLFDDNLRPITPGAPISSSGQIRGVPLRSSAVRPRGRAPQGPQSVGLRSSAVTSTSRRRITGSRTTSALLSQPLPPTTTLPGQQSPLIMGGIRSGGPLTTGTALFNGKEITVDGLKEGQLFDESLQPILPGISGTGSEIPAIIRSSGEISSIPFENVALNPEAKLTHTARLRSSAISSLSGISQTDAGFRSGGSLATGTALFNGKEIRIDGLKEGQMFDENLQPILPGSGGIPSAILSSGQIRGVPSRSAAAPRPISPQRLQPGNLRPSAITSPSSSFRSGSRSSSALLTQDAPFVRAGPLSNTVSSQALGGIRQGGSLTSGAVLFNGRQINIDGLKEGQIFDENLKPILPVSSGMTDRRPAAISSSGQISGVPFRGTVPKPASRSPQKLQGGNLRSSSLTSSSTGAITASGRTTTLSQFTPQRLQPGNLRSTTVTSSSRGTIGSTRTGALVSQPEPGLTAGQLSTALLSGQGNAQMLGGTGSSGSLTSGTALFNGKEISVGGLKEGQLFDENLQPINLGVTSLLSEKSANLPGFTPTGSISAISEVPNALNPQNLQPGGLMASVTGSSSLPAFSSSRLSGGASMGSAQNMGLRDSIVSSPLRSSAQAGGIVRSGDSLEPGTVLFDGKEVNVDGLKAGQIFDENLRPISTATSGSRSDLTMNIIGSTQTSSAPSRNNIPKPRVISPQRTGGAGLRSAAARSSSSGAFASSRIPGASGPQSAAGMRAGSLTNSFSSDGRNLQALVGTRRQTSLTSGTALFNGKEIAIDGLREGQMFDENLKPIPSGASGALAERMSTTLQRPGQISSVSSGGVAPRPRAPTGAARSSVISSSARSTMPGSTISSTQRMSQGIGGTRSASGSVLFNGKEIGIEGLKPGQLYDENLRPITTGISGTVMEKSANLPGSAQISRIQSQNLAPKPRMRAPQRPQIVGLRTSVVSSSTTGGVSGSRTLGGVPAPNIRSEALPAGILPARGSLAPAEIRSGGALTSGTALFDGREIRIDGLKEGQLFDENLRPVIPGTSGGLIENAAPLSNLGPISGILPADIAPKPVSRPSQQIPANRMRSTSSTSSRSAQSLSNARAGPSSLAVSSPQGLYQPIGGARSSGSLTSGTVLFDGKEISIDGLKEGQLFDENLRPIGSVGGYTGSLDSVTNIQRSPSTGNLRTETSTGTSGFRSQVVPTRNSPSASGSLNFIDVTRTDDSHTSSRPSSENTLRMSSGQRNTIGGAFAYASPFGSKVTQDRITPEISQFGVDAPIQESILSIPDDPFKKASALKVPSISRQTQLKMDDVIEQSSLAKPDALRSVQVQETVPFTIPVSSKTVSKKSPTKISQLSQKDIDIPTVQQKILGDFSGYLPKTSFLPPFNYALPSASKYRSPMSQVQQKMEQVFV